MRAEIQHRLVTNDVRASSMAARPASFTNASSTIEVPSEAAMPARQREGATAYGVFEQEVTSFLGGRRALLTGPSFERLRLVP